MDLGLQGSNVYLAGGSGGIGLALSQGFLREGCNVFLGCRTTPVLDDLQKSAAQNNTMVQFATVDFRSAEGREQWLETGARAIGTPDILVWNVTANSRTWAEAFETDLHSAALLVEMVLRDLRGSARSSIVFVGSQSSSLATPHYKPYPAMKAALTHYSASLALELASIGVRSNVVSPGEVFDESGIWGRIARDRPEKYRETIQGHVRGRLCSPEEVAAAVVFLASPVASFVSGVDLKVDGANRQFY